VNRRRLLTLLSTGVATTFAGCAGDSGGDQTETEPATATDTPSATPTAQSSATATNSPTASPTDSATATAADAQTASPTGTPTDPQTPTATATEQSTEMPTTRPTTTSSQTPSATPTQTPPATPSQTPSATPAQTPSATPSPTATPQQNATVVAEGTSFKPLRVSVATGGTVVWDNQSSGVYDSHTVTSAQFHEAAASWSFDETFEGGETLSHTFDSAGVYEYTCTIHGKGSMCGAVLVGGATLEAGLPCGGSDSSDGPGGGY
jgi:plastocyanin